jgi:hypothetical protein
MRAIEYASRACAVGLWLTACGGNVDIAQSPPDGGAHGGDDGGSTADDGGSAEDAWDGWSGGFADKASGPPPSCSSTALPCGDPFPGMTRFTSSQEAANALVGKWSFCGQPAFPPSATQLGEEYTADGTYYQLMMGSNGQLVRNLDPTTSGNWGIDLAPLMQVEIHTMNGNVQRTGGLSACPPSLVIGGVVEARIP